MALETYLYHITQANNKKAGHTFLRSFSVLCLPA